MTAQARRRTTKKQFSTSICMPVLAAAALVLLSSGTGIAMIQNVHLGVDFLAGFPRGEFRDNLDTNAYGLSAYGLHGMHRIPLGIGLELGYMNYGSQERREPLSPTIPGTTVNVRTSNLILASHLFLRLQPRRGSVRPYADGLFGFKYLYTRTSVKRHWSSEPIAVTTNLDDWALSYGAGGGVQVLLYQKTPQTQRDRPVHLFLDVKLRYLRGSPADYLTPGSIRQENGQLVYYVSRSRTDMLLTQVGITLRF